MYDNKAIVKKTGAIVTTFGAANPNIKNGHQADFHILEDTEVSYNERELDFINDIWAFIEKYLDNYYQDERVALSDDIQCCLDAEADAWKLERVIAQCGRAPEEWEREQLRIDLELLNEAADNYYRQIYGRDRSR